MPSTRAPEIELLGRIEHLEQVDDKGCRWVGWVDLLGATFHVEFLRVEMGEDGCQGVPGDATETEADVFEDMQAFYEGVYHTVNLPGVEGEFVMFIYPFCQ